MIKFFRLLFFLVLIHFLLLSSIFASQKSEKNVPQPFGLKLGISTRNEVERVIKKERGEITKEGYRVIKGDIVNPHVKGIKVKGLPIENLTEATFWFFEDKLFSIVYTFPLSMNKEEFYVLYKQLETKYGKPKKYVKPYLADGIAEWYFGDIVIKLYAPWVSWSMYLRYEHLPLSKQAEQSDKEVFKQEVSKPKKGL